MCIIHRSLQKGCIWTMQLLFVSLHLVSVASLHITLWQHHQEWPQVETPFWVIFVFHFAVDIKGKLHDQNIEDSLWTHNKIKWMSKQKCWGSQEQQTKFYFEIGSCNFWRSGSSAFTLMWNVAWKWEATWVVVYTVYILQRFIVSCVGILIDGLYCCAEEQCHPLTW